MPVAAAVPGADACGHGGMPGVPAGSLGLHAVCLVTPVCVSPPIAHVLDENQLQSQQCSSRLYADKKYLAVERATVNATRCSCLQTSYFCSLEAFLRT